MGSNPIFSVFFLLKGICIMSKLSDMHDSKLISENNVKAYAEKLAKLFEGTIPVPDLKVRTSREPIEHLKSNQKAIISFFIFILPNKIFIIKII